MRGLSLPLCADLANDLGNLAQRSLSMVAKNLGGEVPEPGEFMAEDLAMLRQAEDVVADYRAAFDAEGVHPDDVRTLDDLATLPFTTKADLREIWQAPDRATAALGRGGANGRSLITTALAARSCQP